MSGVGLISAKTTMSNVQSERFLRVGAPIDAPTLVDPVFIQGNPAEGGLAVPAEIRVPGTTHGDPAYVGAMKLLPGGNVAAPEGANGIVIRAAAGALPDSVATVVEIGTDAEGPNQLLIAGDDGLGQVYDEKYNQPVALRNVTLSNISPTNTVDTANPGEIFRCIQAGVAQSAIAAIGCNFQVPKTGFYAVAIEVRLGNAPAPASQSIVLPIGVSGGPVPSVGTNIGGALTFAFTGPDPATTNTPYGVTEVNAVELSQTDAYTVGGLVIKQIMYMQLFDSTELYTFTLKSDNALWNIGTQGQIKAELIAMC